MAPLTEKSRWTLPTGEIVHFPRGLRQEKALELVLPGEALLDVGCGRGAVASALSPRFREVHGVDGDPEPLEEAARRGVETAVVDLDAEPLPFPDARFDAVLCLEVIEHVRDPAALARELARVLRPGGALYLSTPNVRFVGYLRRLVLNGRFPLTSEDPEGWQGGHIHFFTFGDVEDLLRENGFDVVEHVGLYGARYARGTRVLPERLAREFLAVGIFSVARRATTRVTAQRRRATREPRAS